MKWYRAKFSLKSWAASEWQSDTIFGHLCWGILFLYGEERFKDFLGRYDAGDPPLLISNGFPAGTLPCPILSPLVIDLSIPLDKQRADYRWNKEVRQNTLISLRDFNDIINGRPETGDAAVPDRIKRVNLKNQLNRNTSTTDPGGVLFNFEEYYLPIISVYMKIHDDFVDIANELMQYISDTGFGKRKSVGYGQVDLVSFEPFSGFELPHRPTGFVSLSNFIPAATDPVNGRWRVLIKYGKLGEAYAQEENAFKKPLVMLESGSVFYDSPIRDYYGRMVNGISSVDNVLQYGYSLPVPMILPPTHNNY